MRKKVSLRYAFGIMITTIILTGVFRKLIIRPETPIAPKEYSEKHKAFYQYNYDGDTAVFYVEGLGKQVVRFLGVDSPEKDEEGFYKAKDYTHEMLTNALIITLELDPNSPDYDKYERLLAWVWTDGQLLQAKILESGNGLIRYLEDDYLYTDYLLTINVTK